MLNKDITIDFMCKVLRNFTILILSKDITIDFNGPEDQIYQHENFLHQVIPIIIVDNLWNNLFHSVKWAQQP